MIGEDGLSDFLLLFTQDARANLDVVTASLDAGDLPAAARAAHAMVSSAGNVGARRLSALARTLENTAKSGDAVATRDMLRQMEDCWQSTGTAIANLAEKPRTAVA
jgi:HPt (histidine-containing phosphotransfer) domain-containing protein